MISLSLALPGLINKVIFQNTPRSAQLNSTTSLDTQLSIKIIHINYQVLGYVPIRSRSFIVIILFPFEKSMEYKLFVFLLKTLTE